MHLPVKPTSGVAPDKRWETAQDSRRGILRLQTYRIEHVYRLFCVKRFSPGQERGYRAGIPLARYVGQGSSNSRPTDFQQLGVWTQQHLPLANH